MHRTPRFLSVVNGNLKHSSHIPFTLTDDGIADGVAHAEHFPRGIEPIIQSVARLHRDKTICNMLRRVCRSARKLGRKDESLHEHCSLGKWLTQDVCRTVLALELESCVSIVRDQARLAMDHVPEVGAHVIVID
jgi:hypothetical protein